jgi:hypothetical protein
MAISSFAIPHASRRQYGRLRAIVALNSTVALLGVLLGGFAPPDASAAECEPGRVYLEAQDWWKDAVRPSGEFGEHIHIGTCFPWGRPVTGRINFLVDVEFHNNPATLLRLRPHIVSTAGQSIQAVVDLDRRAPGGNWTWTVPVTLDTTLVPFDGWQEFRFMVMARHADGDEQYVSTGWMLNLQNGRPHRNYKPDSQAASFTEGRGWYERVNYTNARYSSVALAGPVSGIWSPNVDLKPGAQGRRVIYSSVAVDPNIHAGDVGTIVFQRNGQYVGPISIDTTRFPDGPHRLVLRADAQFRTGRNSGLQIIPFVIDN